jgi:hypothetical protein
MRLDSSLTSDRTTGAHPGAKKILIYDATPHPLSNLNRAKCGPGTTTRDIRVWAVNMLKQGKYLPDIEHIQADHQGAADDMDTKEHAAT